MSGRLVDIGGAELYCEIIGDGPPVFAMHGGMGFDLTTLRPWLDPLREYVSLVYVDARGCGRSARPNDWSTLTLKQWVDDVDALRRALGHDRVTLLGHSGGSIIGYEYACAYPTHVVGLVLVGAFAAFNFVDTLMAMVGARVDAGQLAAVQTAFAGPMASDQAYGATFREILPAYLHRYEPALGEALLGKVRWSSGALNQSVFGFLPTHDATLRLGAIDAPTLVVAGDDDPFMPLAEAYEPLCAAIPGAKGVVVEACGHFPFAENQAGFLAAVEPWLEELHS